MKKLIRRLLLVLFTTLIVSPVLTVIFTFHIICCVIYNIIETIVDKIIMWKDGLKSVIKEFRLSWNK